MSAPLPPCPLCGKDADRYPRSKQIRCENAGCSLYVVGWFPEAAWRHLSAPLAPETIAVLETLCAMNDREPSALSGADETKEEPVFAAFILAFRAYIAAGRPGLPEGKP